jgi:cellobiose-specific phosphotransferase system component IIC
MNPFALFSWFAAFIAVVFLIYSILNREKLQIPWTHPRILAESGLILLFVALGLLFLN